MVVGERSYRVVVTHRLRSTVLNYLLVFVSNKSQCIANKVKQYYILFDSFYNVTVKPAIPFI